MYFTSAILLQKEDKLVLEVYGSSDRYFYESKAVFHCAFSQSAKDCIINTFRRQINHYATLSITNVHRAITRSLRTLTVSTPLMTDIGDAKYEGITHGKAYWLSTCLTNRIIYTNSNHERRSANIPNSIEMYHIIRQECMRSRQFANRANRRVNRATETLLNRKPEKFERLSCSDRIWFPDADRAINGIKAGIELEFSRATNIEGDRSYMAATTDGSLPDCGREIVTRPGDIEEHIQNIGEWLDYNNRNLAVDKSCGMHIHVDKRHLPKDALTVLIDRVYDRKNRVKYRQVAGRGTNDYWTLHRQNTRYTAINTEPYNTVEFRLFSGTKSKHKVKRRLQWIKAVVNYANNPNNIAKAKEARLQLERKEKAEKAERYSILFSNINDLVSGRINVTQEFLYEYILDSFNSSQDISISCMIEDDIRNSGLMEINSTANYLVFFSSIKGVIWKYSGGVCLGYRVNNEIIDLVKKQEGNSFFRYIPHFNNTNWEEYYRQHRQEKV